MIKTKFLVAFLILHLVLMLFSVAIDLNVILSACMVLYISALLVLGSKVGAVASVNNNSLSKEVSLARRMLPWVIGFSLLLFVLKWLVYIDDADFSSYSTFRISFLVRSHGLIGIGLQVSLWLGLIFSGVLVADKIQSPEYKFDIADLYFFVAIMLALFLSGSRSVVLLFFAGFISHIKNFRFLFKPKIIIYLCCSLSVLLYVLGEVRGISISHRLIPWDSFVVGPHLLAHNMDVIAGQTIYLDKISEPPPGVALFSGLYVGLNILFSYLDVEVFRYHLERVFWARHQFDFISAFDNEYNSYYTAGLAVVIEGWLTVGLMAFFMGLTGHYFRFSFSRLVYPAALYYFALCLFRVSVFQNIALSMLVFIVVLIEVVGWVYSLYLMFREKY